MILDTIITNFDNETSPLNNLEKEAATLIAKCLISHHSGEDKAVTGEAIGKGMANSYPKFVTANGKPYLNGARIRKIVNYLRTDGGVPFIIATSKGYYVASNAQQIRDSIRSLRERAKAIQHVADCIECSYNKQFSNAMPI